MNKLLAFAGAGAMLMASATPAFAGWHMPYAGGTTNTAFVTNTANASTNTGYNFQAGKGGTVATGIAVSDSTAVVVANTSLKDCGCMSLPGKTTNTAFVTNTSNASTNTGNNTQVSSGWSWHSTNPVTVTGDAASTSNAWTVVNTQIAWH